MKHFIHSFALLGLLVFACGCVKVATGSSSTATNSDSTAEAPNPEAPNPMKIARFTNDDVELGRVKWRRDLKQAFKDSKKTGKPIFVQFQEVPG